MSDQPAGPEGKLLVVDGRPWPFWADADYVLTGEELQTLLTEAVGAASAVFLKEDPQKVMPTEELTLTLHNFTVESGVLLGKAHDRGKAMRGEPT